MHYYYSEYTDFIAEIDFVQAVPNGLTGEKIPDSDAVRQAIIDGTLLLNDLVSTSTQRVKYDHKVGLYS